MSEEWVIDNFVFFSFVIGSAALIMLAIFVPAFLIYRSYQSVRRRLLKAIDDIEVEEVRFDDMDRRRVTDRYLKQSKHETHRHDQPARIYRKVPRNGR